MNIQAFARCQGLSWLVFGRSAMLAFSTHPVCVTFLRQVLIDYRENRENGNEYDNPNSPFPDIGFCELDINYSTLQPGKWPDDQDCYWWDIMLKDGSVISDFYWAKDKIRGYPCKDEKGNNSWHIIVGHRNGMCVEGFYQVPNYGKGFPRSDGYYYYDFYYQECGAIKQWMKEKDLNYLSRIKHENPTLYQKEIKNFPNFQEPSLFETDNL